MDNNVRILPPGTRQVKPPSRFGGILPMLMALLYGVSPIDLIPDLIPLLGWSDDAMVVVIALTLVMKWLRNKRRYDRQVIRA